jgi:hypothetical protein
MGTSVRNGRVGGWTRALLSAATVLAFLAAAMVGCGGGGGGSGDEDGGGGGNPGGGNPGTGTGGSITNSASEAWVGCETLEDGDEGCFGMSFRSGGKLFMLMDTDDLGYGWVSMELGTWSTSGSRLTTTICGETGSGQYSVSGSTLTIFDADSSATFTKRTGLNPKDYKVIMAEMLEEMGVDPSYIDDYDYCDFYGDEDGGFLKSRAKKSPQKTAKSILSKIKK